MSCPYGVEQWDSEALINDRLQQLQGFGPVHELTRVDQYHILKNVATYDKIDEYLASSPRFTEKSLRDGTHWTGFPFFPRHEIDLYKPLEILIKHILGFFSVQPHKRRVFNAFDTYGEIHKERRALNRWTLGCMKQMPVLSVLAVDEDNFRNASDVEDFNFAMCVTPIEVRMYGTRLREEEENAYLAQCAVYAEHIFSSQPGRRSVAIPLLTKHHIRLYIFDQAGALRGPWVDIHQNPDAFIRILLFTLSRSAVALGAHPSFTYVGSEQCITVKGVKYRVKNLVYELPRAKGGPCCVWRVVDPEGKERVIKWCCTQTEGFASEYDTLNLLKGLDGVAEIVDYEEEQSILELRDMMTEEDPIAANMLENVIVMESYGESLERFTSPLQFLGAFRDVIAGHQNMWNTRVLHRDISYRNILLGAEGAPEGSRGVLIDMDRAVVIEQDMPLPKADNEIGTNAFQSYNVIRAQLLESDERTTHDYLDDLESFIWVFLWITMAFESVPNEPARHITQRHVILGAINSQSARKATKIRRQIMAKEQEVMLHPSYPPQFDVLKTRLIKFLRRSVLRFQKNAEPVTWEDLDRLSEEHYDLVLGYIDDAIADLQGLRLGGTEIASTTSKDSAEQNTTEQERRNNDEEGLMNTAQPGSALLPIENTFPRVISVIEEPIKGAVERAVKRKREEGDVDPKDVENTDIGKKRRGRG